MIIKPVDNLTITQDTVLEKGVYHFPEGISVKGNSLTLDGNGSVLVGDNYANNGISCIESENITIRNFVILGYHHGIYAKGVKKLTISGCRIQATHEIPANTIFLDIWIPVEKTYGSGILLDHVQDSIIQSNDLSHQMNGLLTYNCHGLQVKHNLANYCSGWGFHLNETSQCIYEDNYADYCCRYEPRGERKGHMGADATGFLLVYNSCNNIFRRNRARLGGDGFFLAGMTPEYEPVGCDNNLFEDNDASYSPNNAFEATFSQGNTFRGNFANYCNYGFWLGFSKDGVIEDNQVVGNRQAGIATENGINFRVQHNNFSNNRHGILLWSKHVPQFDRGMPENTTSLNWLIQQNTFSANHKAIRIAADQDHGIRPLPATGELGLPAAKPANHVIQGNLFDSNVHVIEQIDTLATSFDANELRNNYDEQV